MSSITLSEEDVKRAIAQTLQFLKTVDSVFDLGKLLSQIKEMPPSRGGKKNPDIPTGNIVAWILFCVHVAAGGFKQLEGIMAKMSPDARKGALFFFKHMEVLPCSDATLEDRLIAIDIPSLDKFCKNIVEVIRSFDVFTNPRIPGKRVALMLDGSHFFNGLWGCALMIAGEANIMIDFEPYTGCGKEWKTGLKLLKRNWKWIKRCVNEICADGLYWKSELLKMCANAKLDFTVKVSKKDDKEGKPRRDYRKIITKTKQAMEYKRKKGRNPKGITVSEHTFEDTERKVCLQVVRVIGLTYAEVSAVMYYVKGYRKRGGKKEKVEYFLMSTISDPAHAIGSSIERWQIEETFDKVKNTYNIKDDFIYKGNTKEYSKAESGKAMAKFRRLMKCVMAAYNIISFYVWMSSSRSNAAKNARNKVGEMYIKILVQELSHKEVVDRMFGDTVFIQRLVELGHGKFIAKIIAEETGNKTLIVHNTS